MSRRLVAAHATPVLVAHRAFLDHALQCEDCRTDGLDCEEAAALRQKWRDVKGA